MNKYIIPTVIVVFVLTVVGIFFVKRNSNNIPKPNKNVETNTNGNGNMNKNSVVEDLMGKKALMCEWSTSEDGQTVKGKIYTDGKDKMYSEANIKFNGNDMTTYSIVSGDWVYSWRKGSNEGTKFNLKELDKSEAEQYLPDSDFLDENIENIDDALENNSKYKCAAWKVDESLFAVPKNVTFRDLAEMMNNLQNQQQNLQEKLNVNVKDAEKVCDMVPEEYREDCLKNLNGDD